MIISKICRVFVDITVVTMIILFLPGVPPKINFQYYELPETLALDGPLSQNRKLEKAEFLYEGKFTGPESIIAKDGHIYTGLIGGDIIKIDPNGKIHVVTRIGEECEGKWEEAKCGRPLGMRWYNGKIIVNDCYYGLYSIDPKSGNTVQLVSSKSKVDGRFSMTMNDLDVSKDGVIYFSDSSQFLLQNCLLEFLGEPTGRLLKYDPKTKTTTALLNNIQFANGVQLAKDESFVLVAETARNRVIKYYLKGTKAGTSETFIEGLPGSPDNIRPDGKGGFLISLLAITNPDHPNVMKFLAKLPLLRKFIARITSMMYATVSFVDSIFPNVYTGTTKYYINHLEPVASLNPVKGSIVLQIDENGRIKSSMHTSTKIPGKISEVSIDDKGQFAYFGSPYNHGIWKIKVSDLQLK